MASNFFTNQGENTLYKKFVGVFEHMQNIEYFKSVLGYFRASGYFAIRKHFPADLKANEVYKLRNETDANKLKKDIIKSSQKYTSKIKCQVKKDATPLEPKIIISETFV